jgi:predicted lipoprotein with Yx(FWY)xxD motif
MYLKHQPNAVTAAARGPRMIVAAAAVAALAAASLALHPPATHAAQAKGAVVSTATTGLGRIIVNSSGRALYLFEKDRNGKSACSGQCAVFWPPLITSGKPGVTGGARASLIGTTRRSDGRLQVTYNHHPLYTFVKDKKAGQTNGEGVNAFGAAWDAISPAGARIDKKAGSGATATPPANAIPQNNGGDSDSDNNGGPSDGDGNI